MKENFLDHLKSIDREQLALRATQSGLRCSAGHLENVRFGVRKASRKLVQFIVADSDGKLTDRDGQEYLWGDA